MPKIEINNHLVFTSVEDIVNNIIRMVENAQLKKLKYLCPQVTVVFGNIEDELQFCSLLCNVFLQKGEDFDFLMLYSPETGELLNKDIMQFQISAQNIEHVMDRIAWYPAQGGTPLVLRMPTCSLTSLYVSAFAGCRNFFLITTLINEDRDKQLFYLTQRV